MTSSGMWATAGGSPPRHCATTLRHERATVGGGLPATASAAKPGTRAGHLTKRAGDFVGTAAAMPAMGRVTRGMLGQLREEASRRDRLGDPAVRRALVGVHELLELNRLNVLRARAGGATTGAEANIAKLLMSATSRRACTAAGLVAGLDAVRFDGQGSDLLTDLVHYSPAPSIYGGTDQIQRNVIAERVLGLPR